MQLKTSEFDKFHPLVNFLYFVAVIAFSMVMMHPVCLVISVVCGFLYSVMLCGKKSVGFSFKILLPMLIGAAVFNPVFNHRGITILTYLPVGNPLTLESIIYGIAAAVMLGSVFLWFTCVNRIMTADKLMYIAGRVVPSLSLIISMVMRFVPEFAERTKKVADIQKANGRAVTEGGIVKRAKRGITVLSVMIISALENSVQTADSMKCRGWGLKGRTAYFDYAFEKRDVYAVFFIVVLSAFVAYGKVSGAVECVYYPIIRFESTMTGNFVFAAYILLFIMPVFIEVTEVIRWNALKSKI